MVSIWKVTAVNYGWNTYDLPTEFAPSNAWTTGQVLTKTANGYEWSSWWGGGSSEVWVSTQPNNILTSWMKIRAWTQANYESLSSYDSNCLYLTI